MGTHFIEGPAEGERLGDPMARLAEAVARMLDGLPPAAAPAAGRVDAAASALILPHPAAPRVPPGDPARRVVRERRLPSGRLPRPPWPRLLPALAGLAWGIDTAVGLWWLARYEPAGPDEAVLLWRACCCRRGGRPRPGWPSC